MVCLEFTYNKTGAFFMLIPTFNDRTIHDLSSLLTFRIGSKVMHFWPVALAPGHSSNTIFFGVNTKQRILG